MAPSAQDAPPLAAALRSLAQAARYGDAETSRAAQATALAPVLIDRLAVAAPQACAADGSESIDHGAALCQAFADAETAIDQFRRAASMQLEGTSAAASEAASEAALEGSVERWRRALRRIVERADVAPRPQGWCAARLASSLGAAPLARALRRRTDGAASPSWRWAAQWLDGYVAGGAELTDPAAFARGR